MAKDAPASVNNSGRERSPLGNSDGSTRCQQQHQNYLRHFFLHFLTTGNSAIDSWIT